VTHHLSIKVGSESHPAKLTSSIFFHFPLAKDSRDFYIFGEVKEEGFYFVKNVE